MTFWLPLHSVSSSHSHGNNAVGSLQKLEALKTSLSYVRGYDTDSRENGAKPKVAKVVRSSFASVERCVFEGC